MAALSDYLENLLLDWSMTNGSPTRPTAWFVALFTAPPSDSGGGDEVSGNGYSRQSVTFSAAAAGATSNSGSVSFTATGGAWGTITHIGIFTASTAGQLLWHGALTTSKAVNEDDTLTFAAGDIDLTLD